MIQRPEFLFIYKKCVNFYRGKHSDPRPFLRWLRTTFDACTIKLRGFAIWLVQGGAPFLNQKCQTDHFGNVTILFHFESLPGLNAQWTVKTRNEHWSRTNSKRFKISFVLTLLPFTTHSKMGHPLLPIKYRTDSLFAKRDGRGRKRPGANEKLSVLKPAEHAFSTYFTNCVHIVGKQRSPKPFPVILDNL